MSGLLNGCATGKIGKDFSVFTSRRTKGGQRRKNNDNGNDNDNDNGNVSDDNHDNKGDDDDNDKKLDSLIFFKGLV